MLPQRSITASGHENEQGLGEIIPRVPLWGSVYTKGIFRRKYLRCFSFLTITNHGTDGQAMGLDNRCVQALSKRANTEPLLQQSADHVLGKAFCERVQRRGKQRALTNIEIGPCIGLVVKKHGELSIEGVRELFD